ncbi:MAG: type II toxin-antitoxin system HicA family toxin [Clostridia bacterium]|nr:type II toxin-antitoxin system HicA family toxin [Clostridia bacterium]
MSQMDKLIYAIISGKHDTSTKFTDVQNVLKFLEFHERVRGDHFIYTQKGIEEILNLQPDGSKAKPYQVKQVRNIILKYNLGGKDDE